ncbi:unnamed protein product [Meganyctiphanes norvegica]|uniref:Uncharacterized protein n=1 Tax=Meganyctiphanes norvegica TaxID=48144 RepID=A0AAV2PGM4_MEGNR
MPAKWVDIFAGIPKVAPEQPLNLTERSQVANNGDRAARIVVMHGDGRQDLVTLAANTSRCFITSPKENLTVALLDDKGDEVVEMRTVAGGTNLIVANTPPKENTQLRLLVAKADQFWEVDHQYFSRKKEHVQKQDKKEIGDE